MALPSWKLGTIGTAAALLMNSVLPAPAQAQAQDTVTVKQGSKAPRARAGSTTVTTNDDGSKTGFTEIIKGDDRVRIEFKDGKVVRAEHNGQEVPVERVNRDDDKITITDASGAVIFDYITPAATTVTPSPMFRRYTVAPGQPNAKAWSWKWDGNQLRAAGADEDDGTAAPANPPKVMMGVTMVSPDRAVVYHCGQTDTKGVTMIGEVYDGLPAANAGIKPYDFILEIDGKKPADEQTIRATLKEKNPGDEVALTIVNKCERKQVKVKLEGYDQKRLSEGRKKWAEQHGEDVDLFAVAPVAPMVPRTPIPPMPPDVGALIGRDAQRNMMQLQPDLDQKMQEANRRMEELVKRYTEDAARRQERAKTLEERMQHIEEMLKKLSEQQAGGKGGE